MRNLWIAVALASTIAAAAAGTAEAERIAPEFGRCVKLAKGEAGPGYSDPGCTSSVSSGAKFRWLAGPGAKPGFGATTGQVALTRYRPGVKAGQLDMSCSASSVSGEITGTASASIELVMTGCKMGSESCASAGAGTGEVAFVPLEGSPLVLRTSERGEALMRWSPALGETLASFECGGVAVTIGGSMLHPIRDDKMTSSEAERFRAHKEGTQNPECAEPCEPGEQPETSIGGAAPDLSGFEMAGAQSSDEKLELRTFVH